MDMISSSSEYSNDTDLGDDHSLYPPGEFPLYYQILASIIHIIIFVVGVVGNVAVVIVVQKTKSLQCPTYCYLVSLAVADLLVLVSAMPEAIMSHHLYVRQWVLGQAGCSLLIFGNFLGINASSLCIFAFTVERYIGICHPFWAQKVCSNSRAIRIILCIWLFATIYSSSWLCLAVTQKVHHAERSPTTEVPDMEQCTFRLDRYHYVYFFMPDIVLFYLLPLLVSIVLYVRIGAALRNGVQFSRWTPRSMDGNQIGPRTAMLRRSSIEDDGASGYSLTRTQLSGTRDQSRNVQVVHMLMVIVVLFAILWLPYRGLLVYNSFAEKPWLDYQCLLFAKTLIYINCAINPILYNAMSRRFRRAFALHIFRLGKGKAVDAAWTSQTYVLRYVLSHKAAPSDDGGLYGTCRPLPHANSLPRFARTTSPLLIAHDKASGVDRRRSHSATCLGLHETNGVKPADV